MLKKGMEMSSEPYYMGTIISFDATCTGYFTTLTKIFKNKDIVSSNHVCGLRLLIDFFYLLATENCSLVF